MATGSLPSNDADTALRGGAFLQSGGNLQAMTARHDDWSKDDDMAGFVLANGSMSSNPSGDFPARSARRKWATNSQGLGSQRDIRRALIEADLAGCMVALECGQARTLTLHN